MSGVTTRNTMTDSSARSNNNSKKRLIILVAVIVVIGIAIAIGLGVFFGTKSPSASSTDSLQFGTDQAIREEPSSSPSEVVTVVPSAESTFDSSRGPSRVPSRDPTIGPTIGLAIEPAIEPTIKPTIEPTIEPTSELISEPTIEPTIESTIEPTSKPMIEPTFDPSRSSSNEPSEPGSEDLVVGVDKITIWDTPQSGLVLEILNALDDVWDSDLFELVVQEWDNGQPDALTLTTTKVDADFDCDFVEAKLKICNGNYGATNWRGTTVSFLENDFIKASVVKLNDFYRDPDAETQNQYVMCHNIGHGFGLPHTDENFFNPDLGNCLDYTNNPEANKNPGEINYSLLAKLYGKIGAQRSGNSDRKGILNGALKQRIEAAGNHATDLSHGSFRKQRIFGGYDSVLIDLGDGLSLQVHSLLVVS